MLVIEPTISGAFCATLVHLKLWTLSFVFQNGTLMSTLRLLTDFFKKKQLMQ